MKTTIHTLKNEYKDNQTYLNEKQKLFQNLTYHMIEKELNNNNIDIRYKEVLDFYHQCFNTDETIAHFDEKYDQQLDQLGEKNEVFDDDALVIVNQNVHEVSLCDMEGNPYLTVTMDAPLFGVWSPAGADVPFICVEPWYGRCDSADFTGDLKDREW